MNILEVLRRHVVERPNAPALIDGPAHRPRITTFAELDEASARGAAWLRTLGIGVGDPVLIFHPMSRELYVVLLALFRLQAPAMFLDPSAGRAHIERCCLLQPPRALIAGPRAHLLRLIAPALRRIPRAVVLGRFLPFATSWFAAERCEPLRLIPTTEPETPALLTFTSGSTGEPKGTVRTHGFLLAQHARLAEALRLQPGEVDLTTLPIFVLANLGSGVTSVIPDADLRSPGTVAPGPVVAQIRRWEVVSSTASPAFFERLTRHGAAVGETLPTLRKLFTGGAPVFPRLLDQLQQLAPYATVEAVYGSTEAEPIAHLARAEIAPDDRRAMVAGRGLLAGPPIERIQLRILRDRWGQAVGPFTAEEFAADSLPADEPGEIVVAGDHVLQGYLNGRGDEETKFRVGATVWHRTGDAGYLDGRGRLWLLGRCVARITDARGVLYPFAAECAAYEDPRVRRAAVVAHEGRRLMVVEGFSPAERPDLEALGRSLAWARLDRVSWCKQIPVDKRHNAKIDYPVLRKLLEGGRV